MARTELYPPIEAFDVRRVSVDSIHTLHVEQSGNPEGVPVVFLHGGPGSAWSPHVRRFFDPRHYRLIAFDQRGSWRSTPLGELRENTPQHLIRDIEHLRTLFRIERWIVFGGSWGSTLALAYAEAHPQRCLALVVRGVSLGLGVAEGWYFHHSRWVRPAAWAKLMAPFAPEDHVDLPAAMERRILDPDPAIHMPMILAWNEQAAIAGRTRHPDPSVPKAGSEDGPEDPAVTLAGGRLAIVYLQRHAFRPPNDLLGRAHRLKGMPGAIVHGEEDFCCPPSNAWDLHRAWPDAEYRPISDAGHSCFDNGIRAALVETMERLKALR